MLQIIPKVRVLLHYLCILIDVSSLRALLSQANVAAVTPLMFTLQLKLSAELCLQNSEFLLMLNTLNMYYRL